MGTRNLDAVFAPASIAIAGATERAGSVGAQVVRNVVESFSGPIYGINPRLPKIAGVAMHAEIAALPEAPDLAIIVTPADALLQSAEAFAARGTRAALIISDAKRGMVHAGAVRDALRTLADRSGMRIIGPNALGTWSPKLRATMSALKTIAGNIAFIGQATMAAGALGQWAAQHHLGFSGLAAAGDMCDVDFGDLIDWYGADPRTRVVVVFVERLAESRKFISSIRIAARAKPVIVIRADAEPLSPRRNAVFGAALRRAGALQALTLEDLFAALEAVAVRLPSDAPPTLGPRLAILANGESLGALARLAIADSEAELAPLDEATFARLAAILPPGRRRTNPIDILPDASPERFAEATAILLDDKHVDAVLVVFGPSGSASACDVAGAVARVVEAWRLKPGRRRPFVMTAFTGGAAESDARDELSRAHIPAFDGPSGAARAFSALVAMRRAAERTTATPEFIAGPDAVFAADVESRAQAVLAKGATAIEGSVASAVRRALWLGRADALPELTWRIDVEDDPDFGPAIFFGPGGAFARIIAEETAALPPLNAASAQELIQSSPYARNAAAQGLLDDARIYALAALLVRFSDLIAAAPSIRTLTIDHLCVDEARPLAPAEAVSGTLATISGEADARFAIRPYPSRLIVGIKDQDGAALVLRPMRAEDEPALARFGARLSAEDLRLRFFQPMRTLSHDFAARLTQLDYDREMAFALQRQGHDAILGVVRLHRETRGEAGEFAIVVRSDLKGLGYGRLLMTHIIAYARSQRLRSLFGIVLSENTGMLKLSRKLGFGVHMDPHDAAIVRVELDLQKETSKETP